MVDDVFYDAGEDIFEDDQACGQCPACLSKKESTETHAMAAATIKSVPEEAIQKVSKSRIPRPTKSKKNQQTLKPAPKTKAKTEIGFLTAIRAPVTLNRSMTRSEKEYEFKANIRDIVLPATKKAALKAAPFSQAFYDRQKKHLENKKVIEKKQLYSAHPVLKNR